MNVTITHPEVSTRVFQFSPSGGAAASTAERVNYNGPICWTIDIQLPPVDTDIFGALGAEDATLFGLLSVFAAARRGTSPHREPLLLISLFISARTGCMRVRFSPDAFLTIFSVTNLRMFS